VNAASLARWTPLLGLVVWAGLVAARAPRLADEATLAELLVSFVPLVLVPLVLPLAVAGDMSREPGRWARALALAHAVGALAVAVGVLLPTGGAASLALAGLWLAFTGLAALHGLHRFRTRARLSLAELVIDLALLWLPGAAVWLLVYRGELVLGGFGGLAALLTASHFHAAGFATLMMTGLLGRALAGITAPVASTIYRLTAPALLLAFPLLAAGIGGAIRPLELAGAGLYAVFLPVLAALQIRAAIGTRGPTLWRGLLVLSALAVLFATAFAARFAMQGFYGAAVPISTMLRYHALVNMLGFLALGLLAWSRLRPAPLAGPAK
jgi:hypothetical protein